MVAIKKTIIIIIIYQICVLLKFALFLGLDHEMFNLYYNFPQVCLSVAVRKLQATRVTVQLLASDPSNVDNLNGDNDGHSIVSNMSKRRQLRSQRRQIE